jgi:hypothetical protein
MANGGYAAGPLACNTCHNTVTDPSRDGLHGAWVTGITTIEFPSLIKIGGIDKGRGLCGTCHQARQATANLVSAIASKWQDALGLTYASVTANTVGTTTTFIYKNLNMAAVPTPVAPGVGYTAVFNGNVTPALNGARAIVSNVSVGASNTTITFGSSLPAAPASAYVACVAAAAPNTTCMTAPGGSTPVTVPGTGWASTLSWDSAIFYPTATGGTTTTLVDANRSWAANAWVGSYVFFQTGANAGKYAAITANDATSLTFAAVSAPVAGDFYQIVKESPALADEILWADASHATTVATNNPHYLGAVATEYGSLAAGWYQFPGKVYRGSHTHTHLTKNVFDPETGATVTVDRTPTGTPIKVAAATCVDCHDAHTLEINQNACVGCHSQGTEAGVEANKLAKNDFDGDSVTTNNKAEIESVKRTLWTAIKTYSKLLSQSGQTAICFDNATNAYWFISSASDIAPGSDGTCGVDGSGNAIKCCASGNAWGAKVTGTVTEATGMTPRLYRATYNYKFAMKDPGAWVHNPRYVAQVLIDNIVDLNAGIAALGGTPVPFNPAGRP